MIFHSYVSLPEGISIKFNQWMWLKQCHLHHPPVTIFMSKTIPSHGCFSTNFNQVSPGFAASPIFCKSEIGGKKNMRFPLSPLTFIPHLGIFRAFRSSCPFTSIYPLTSRQPFCNGLWNSTCCIFRTLGVPIIFPSILYIYKYVPWIFIIFHWGYTRWCPQDS